MVSYAADNIFRMPFTLDTKQPMLDDGKTTEKANTEKPEHTSKRDLPQGIITHK